MWFGGASTVSTTADSRRVFIYDTRNRRFHEVASLPAAKNLTDQPNSPDTATNTLVAGVLADGSVVVTGGQVSLTEAAVNAQNVLSYRYYPAGDRWMRTGNLPEPQQMSYMPTDLLHDGRLLAIGGGAPVTLKPGGQKSKAAFIYNPRADTVVDGVNPNTGEPTGHQQQVHGVWDYTRTANGRPSQMSEPHDYGNSVVLSDGRVLVTGGHVRWGNASVMSTHTDFFDPGTGAWSQGPVLPVVAGEDDRTPGSHGGRGNGVCMTALPDGDVVVAGGATGTDGAEFFSTMISRQSILTITPAADPMDSTVRLSPAVIPSPSGNGHLFGDEGRRRCCAGRARTALFCSPVVSPRRSRICSTATCSTRAQTRSTASRTCRTESLGGPRPSRSSATRPTTSARESARSPSRCTTHAWSSAAAPSS